MILTGPEIIRQVEADTIHIAPFTPAHVGANSYDVTLNEKLLVYDLAPGEALDMKRDNPFRSLVIPEEGLVLQPGTLYIGCTNETATSKAFVPMFEGRSSIGRLGINTHITAGFGDLGWGYLPDENGNLVCQYPTWTLEIEVVHPFRVYPGVRIGQVYFIRPEGTLSYYKGKYTRQKDPQASQLYRDFAARPSP
ncbi:MAG TPA: dCTP deaminase [Fibrobacteria bacterium]|nr:dCTP deaminase [Fibrobacteria bacterium]